MPRPATDQHDTARARPHRDAALTLRERVDRVVAQIRADGPSSAPDDIRRRALNTLARELVVSKTPPFQSPGSGGDRSEDSVPGERDPAPRDDPGWAWSLALADELIAASLASVSSARRSRGAYYTPAWLIDHILDQAVEPALAAAPSPADVRVCDPACGSGLFLIDAADRIADRLRERGSMDADAALAHATRHCVRGIDIDPVSAALCRWILATRAGLDPEALAGSILCADALLDCPFEPGSFDAVIGNPPFLGQLRTRTVSSRARVRALRAAGVLGDGAYTDEAGAFLVLGLRLAAPTGRVCMVQPQSVLSAHGASWVRDRVTQANEITSLWVAEGHVFDDASVCVCAPCIRRGSSATHRIERWLGRDMEPMGIFRVPSDRMRSWGSWAPIAAGCFGVPEFEIASGGRVGDKAAATADFRDEYYALRGHVRENPDARIRLVTTGLVDLARDRWGQRPARIHKTRWLAPSIDADAPQDPAIARWLGKRLTPKVLVATQTRVIEALVDAEGVLAPVTPLISVTPRDEADLWKLAAAIASPVCAAHAVRMHAGSALHADAIKLSAGQVLDLPVPGDDHAWAEAAAFFERAQNGSDEAWPDTIRDYGRRMCCAYRVNGRDAAVLMDWWADRLGLGSPDA